MRRQFLLGDHAVSMRQQIGEHLKDFRAQWHDDTGPAEDILLRIDFTMSECIDLDCCVLPFPVSM
jgi:hypothetical protein